MRAFQRLNRQPIPGQPPDRGADDALRRVQIGLEQQFKTLTTDINEAAASIPPYSNSIEDVGSSDSAGSANTVARGDHVHKGLHSITGPNGTRYGDVTFTGLGVKQSTGTFTFPGYSVAMFGAVNVLTNPSGGYNVTATDIMIAIVGGPGGSGNPITLPAASAASGRSVWIKNATSATTYDVYPAGADTMDVASPFQLFNSPVNFAGALFVSDGVSVWYTWGMS